MVLQAKTSKIVKMLTRDLNMGFIWGNDWQPASDLCLLKLMYTKIWNVIGFNKEYFIFIVYSHYDNFFKIIMNGI